MPYAMFVPTFNMGEMDVVSRFTNKSLLLLALWNES